MTSSSDAQPAKPVADALARRSISAAVNAFQAGLTQIPALPYAIVCMHLGPSVEVTCSRGGRLRHGREVAGDLDIVPARTPSAWETKQSGTSLIIRVPDLLLQDVANCPSRRSRSPPASRTRATWRVTCGRFSA